jgi:cation diffusion facilitator CzcD-associated flavoprotein CzcO
MVKWCTDTSMEFMMVIAMWKFRYFRKVNVAAADIAKLLRFLTVRDKELRRKLDPDYDFGCKRPTLSNSYYHTFSKPHVHLETSGITRIEPDGIVGSDGGKRFIDTLVLATGFDVWDANLPAIEVIGREGRNLGKWWRENRFQAYEGVSVPYFPNFLTLAGPYAWVGLSWFNTVEYEMRHMDRLFGELQRRGARTFEITEEANARFLDRMTQLLEDSVFRLGNCVTSRSYWFNPSGEAPLFRPTSVRKAVTEQDRFPLSDYAIA